MTLLNLYNRYIRGFTDADRQQLERIEKAIAALANQGGVTLHTLSEIADKVRAQKTVIDSLVEFVKGLAQALKDAKGDQAKIDAIANDLDVNTAEITSAVTANTEPAPTV